MMLRSLVPSPAWIRRRAFTCLFTDDFSWAAADAWFDNKLYLFQDFVTRDRPPNQPKIRVAILDSGIDRNDVAIQFAMTSRPEIQSQSGIQTPIENPPISKDNCRGFPDVLDPLEDKYGHGTCCAALLLRTAPEAELFIGRIADDNGRMDKGQDYRSTVEVLPAMVILRC